MRLRWICLIDALIVLLLIGLLVYNCSATERLDDGQLHLIEATAYCDKEQLTSTGAKPRIGIAAFDPKYYGCAADIYDEDMNYITTVEILDTGSERIKNGEVIDIWFETEQECIEFGRRKVYILLIKGVG